MAQLIYEGYLNEMKEKLTCVEILQLEQLFSCENGGHICIDIEKLREKSFFTLQKGQSISSEVLNIYKDILNSESARLHQSRVNESGPGSFTGSQVIMSNVIFVSNDLTLDGNECRNTGISEIKPLIAESPKVIFPVLVLNSRANIGHYVATLVDFTRKEVTVYDTSGHDGNYIIVHALMKKWLLDLYGSQGKELPEWIYFGVYKNQVDRYEINKNCGVSVMMTCSYILLGLEINFYGEDMNVWRKKIALKILKHLYAPQSSSVIIDLTY